MDVHQYSLRGIDDEYIIPIETERTFGRVDGLLYNHSTSWMSSVGKIDIFN
jgi:hypothetical protein